MNNLNFWDDDKNMNGRTMIDAKRETMMIEIKKNTIKTKIFKLIMMEGLIGAGKTTFLKNYEKISSKFPNKKIALILEPIEEWQGNNKYNIDLLDLMYKDIKKYVGIFQIYVLSSHFNNMLSIINSSDAEIFIMERSIYSSRYVFTEMHRDAGNIDDQTMLIIEEQFASIDKMFIIPDEIFYMDTTPEVCFERIKKRARPQEKNITIEYLRMIEKQYSKMFEIIKEKYPQIKISTLYNI